MKGKDTNSSSAVIAQPVHVWAVMGLIMLTVAAYVIISWILSPYFRPAPVGADPLPEGQLYMIRFVEISCVALSLVCIFKFLIMPIIREKQISWDGIFLISILFLWWQDPIVNYVNYGFMYNSHLFNMSSWASFIPGFSYPNHENYPEPLLMMSGFYIFFFFGSSVVGSNLLRWANMKWPRAGYVTLLFWLFVAFSIFDAIIEIIFMGVGVAAFAGVIQSMSVFAGEPNQYPLYQAPIIGAMLTMLTSIRYFRDNKGLSWAEKGVDKLQYSSSVKKIISFLAISGMLQLYFLFFYFLPYNVFVAQSDTTPAFPSYMRNNICGTGTDYACPSKQYVPIPHRDGTFAIRPDDPRLPEEVREKQSGKPYGFFKD